MVPPLNKKDRQIVSEEEDPDVGKSVSLTSNYLYTGFNQVHLTQERITDLSLDPLYTDHNDPGSEPLFDGNSFLLSPTFYFSPVPVPCHCNPDLGQYFSYESEYECMQLIEGKKKKKFGPLNRKVVNIGLSGPKTLRRVKS